MGVYDIEFRQTFPNTTEATDVLQVQRYTRKVERTGVIHTEFQVAWYIGGTHFTVEELETILAKMKEFTNP